MAVEVTTRDPDYFTVGYEGRKLGEFIDGLNDQGIEQVVDVRERAMSRKPGFSGGALRQALEDTGITYRHIPQLGSPSSVRAEYKETRDFAIFSERYNDHLADHGAFVVLLLELILLQRTALLCFERDSETCHRSLISHSLEGAGLSVGHI